MKRYQMAAVAVLGIFASGSAYADQCNKLAGKQLCLTFKYSTGTTNNYLATFNADGTFDLNGTSPGTYTCPGTNLVAVDYNFGGFELQEWMAATGGNGRKLNGFGRHNDGSTPEYMYRINVNNVGPCATLAPAGAPINRAKQSD